VLTNSTAPESAPYSTATNDRTSQNAQEEGSFEVDVLTITAEHRLLLGVVIDEESYNRPPGLLRSEEFEAI